MTEGSAISTAAASRKGTTAFSEAAAWARVGAGWRQLAGSFRERGFSFEWHEFVCTSDLDWGASFHPGSVELCLNLDGGATIEAGGRVVNFAPHTAGFYSPGNERLRARRQAKGRHQFITVEYSPAFLARHLGTMNSALHPLVARAAAGKPATGVGDVFRLGSELQQLVISLRHPPVLAAAQGLWYESKALELMTACFFRETEELFCSRQNRMAQERVEKILRILKRDLTAVPPLEEIAREVGCSHFYLSRTFSKEMGVTIPQHLRQLRLERAAELLRSGDYNVTEAALEVGYSSLSHFSSAFHEMFGCCPGLYPMVTPAQKAARDIGKS
jgi:AraC-like DNA-binding protein